MVTTRSSDKRFNNSYAESSNASKVATNSNNSNSSNAGPAIKKTRKARSVNSPTKSNKKRTAISIIAPSNTATGSIPNENVQTDIIKTEPNPEIIIIDDEPISESTPMKQESLSNIVTTESSTITTTNSKPMRVKKEPISRVSKIKKESTSVSVKAEPIPEVLMTEVTPIRKSKLRARVKSEPISEETMNTAQSSKRHLPEITTMNKKVKIEKNKPTTTPKSRVKKEPKAPKKKSGFTLPPEAYQYLDDKLCGRVTRAMQQRMFVLSREPNESDDSIEKFEVLGSVGNNYTVTVANKIKCTCMDYNMRRGHCKHILMILLKVYHVPFDNHLFQSLNTTKEQRLGARIYSRAVDPSILVPEKIRQQILGIGYKNHPDAASSSQGVIDRRPLDTSDCPVCFEEFEKKDIEKIDFCKTCGNNIHKECFTMWSLTKGTNVTCVFCRSQWITGTSKSTEKNKVGQLDPKHIHESYYANYAAELNMSLVRDTSTYRDTSSYRDRYY